MPMFPEDYKRLVLDDIATYAGLAQPVKSGLLERVFRRKTLTANLHPNPEDEFCNPDIGPNYEIIGTYQKQMSAGPKLVEELHKNRLCVEKMSTGGYMLLDGHHRWYAAHRVGIEKLPIEILNVTSVEHIISRVSESDRRMCVSFDLDEVLLTDGKTVPAARSIPLFNKPFVKKALRLNAPQLIRGLQEMGFDVWVYTAGYISETGLNRLFRMHRVKVNGIVNGFRSREDRKKLREAFANKYEVSLHIDGSDIVWVNTKTREYGTVTVGAAPGEWSAKTITAVRGIELVKRHTGCVK